MDKLVRAIIWAAVILGLLGVIGRILFFDMWTVPDTYPLNASVAPTLRGGDTVLVTKQGTPGFGDLVRCTDPEDPAAFVVGRIVGLPGDKVEVQGGKLVVNNVNYGGESGCLEPTFLVTANSGEVKLNCDKVRVGTTLHERGYRVAPLFGILPTVMEVPTDRVFLLSDDREFHEDSRDFGALPRSSCKTGHIMFRLWSKLGWSDDRTRMTIIN